MLDTKIAVMEMVIDKIKDDTHLTFDEAARKYNILQFVNDNVRERMDAGYNEVLGLARKLHKAPHPSNHTPPLSSQEAN
jgi:hypothetical protein